MGLITRENWLECENAAIELWDLESKVKKDYIPMTYNVETSTKSEEKNMGVGAAGLMAPWNGTVSYQDFAKGFEKGYRHAKYSSGMQVEEEIFRFGEYRKIKDRVRKLNDAVYKTLQAHAVSTFNLANDATIVGPDGAALCSTTHHCVPNDDHQSNIGALDLTNANLDTVMQAMTNFKDDKGDLMGVTPNMLMVGPYYRTMAKKICGTTRGEVGTAENDMNVWADELTYMYNPRILGKTWFMVDSTRMKLFLNWFNARVPTLESEEDFNTEVMMFKVIGMWSYGWDHWDWVFGNWVA